MSKAPSQEQQITIGFRVRRDKMPLIKRVAKRFGYKSVSAWAGAIFDSDFNAKLLEMTNDGDAKPEQAG